MATLLMAFVFGASCFIAGIMWANHVTLQRLREGREVFLAQLDDINAKKDRLRREVYDL